MNNALNKDRRGALILRLISIIAGVGMLALAVFVLMPGHMAKLTNDGVITEYKLQYVKILWIALFHGGALFVFMGLVRFSVVAGIEGKKDSDNPVFDLFTVSFLILFLELVFIRWVPPYVKVMTYFKNFILLASFTGMGLGCMIDRSRMRVFRFVPFLIAGVVVISQLIYALAMLTEVPYLVGGLGGSEEIFFGLEVAAESSEKLRMISTALLTSGIYILVMFIFIGPGQIMGDLFNRFDKPINAYCVNVGASIAGILGFTLLSYMCAPSWLWFIIAAAIILLLLYRSGEFSPAPHVVTLVITVSMVFISNMPLDGGQSIWSPYYRIQYIHPVIKVNQISHQAMVDVADTEGNYTYHLPYLMARDSGGKDFKRVMVIGAGSGNDVSHALHYGAGHVDAVEIDPVILNIGKKNHPNQPYSETDRVTIINDDGRSFLMGTDEKYDMIVYALVDSLTLMSNYSSLRLENYLFTMDAFEQVKSKLKPDGIFVMYNFFREPWLTMRLDEMLEEVFDQEPLLILIPAEKELGIDSFSQGHMSVFMSGGIDNIKENLEKSGEYNILTGHETLPENFNGFFDTPPSGVSAETIYKTKLNGKSNTRLPVDDWPFTYLRNPEIPSHNILGLMLVGGISAFFITGLMGVKKLPRLSIHYMFLGGAFMLLETESVVKLALIHGSTWTVNSIVFASVLIMIFLANILIIKKPMKSSVPAYILLFLALAANYFVPLDFFLGKGWVMESLLSSVLVFIPIAFAGLVFANSYRNSKQPAIDLGSNLLGIIAGGIVEYFSLATGYNALLILAALMYLVSMIAIPKRA